MNNTDITNHKLNYRMAGLFVSRGEWCHPGITEPTYEIILVMSGKVHIREEQTEYTLEKNSLLLLSPGKYHVGTRSSKNVSFYWLHFTTDAVFEKKHFELTDTAQLVALFRMLLHTLNTPFYPRSSAEYTLRLILNEIRFVSGKSEERDKAAYMAAEYALSNIRLRLSVADIAEHLGYNPDYLCRIFKKTFGKTLKQFVAEETIKRAKTLLTESGSNISNVACELGFETENLFTKFFKYHEGMSPSQYVSMCYNTHINHK